MTANISRRRLIELRAQLSVRLRSPVQRPLLRPNPWRNGMKR